MRKQFLLMLVLCLTASLTWAERIDVATGPQGAGGGGGPQGCGERGAKRGRDQWPALGK